MKTCPSCQRTYADNALPFCPQDGTQLVASFPAYNPQPPVANLAPTQMNYAPAYNQPAYVQPTPQAVGAMPRAMPHNPMRKWVQISKVTLIVACVLLLLFLIMAIGGYASNPFAIMAAIFGGCGLLFGIIGFFSYGKQATTIDEIFKQAGNGDGTLTGGNLLAHWTYSPQEWSQFVQSETARNKSANILVLCVLGLVFLFIIVRALLAARSGGGAIGLLISFVIFGGIMLFVWWFSNAEMRNLKARNTGEAFISPTGLMLNDRYYPWNVMGTSLTGVYYEQGNPNALLFKYQQWGAQNVGSTAIPAKYNKSVRVPVPMGREGEAQNIAAHFPG